VICAVRGTRGIMKFGDDRIGVGMRALSAPKMLGCYMVKPHGQLVRVSFTRYRASTSRLSTSWSSTDLQGPQGSRETSSWEGLPA
jgi:hypothetical protein